MRRVLTVLAACACAHSAWAAKADESEMPHRTNGQNYKDRALAACVATVYKGSPAGTDASSTAGAYLEWTYFDLELDPQLDALIDKYAARTYVGSPEGGADAHFGLLKCIDFYRSKELEQLTRKAVPHPTWVGDKPAKARKP